MTRDTGDRTFFSGNYNTIYIVYLFVQPPILEAAFIDLAHFSSDFSCSPMAMGNN